MKPVTFGRKLAEIRKSKGLTQLQISSAIGIPLQNYVLYENDKYYPKAFTLLRLSVVLQLDPLIFAEYEFIGSGCPMKGAKVSRSLLKRIYGEISIRGIKRINNSVKKNVVV